MYLVEKKYLGKEITVSGPIKDAWFRYPLPPFYPLVLIGTKSAGSLDVLCIISKEKREDISKLKAGYDGTIKGTVSFIGYYQDERNNMHIDLEPCEIIFQEYVEQEYEEEHEESIDSSKLIEELIEKGKFKFILKRKGDISVKGFIETVDTNDIVRASKILLKGHDNYPNKINCNIGKTSPDFYEKIKTLNANDEVIVTGYLSGVSDEENIEIDDCGIN